MVEKEDIIKMSESVFQGKPINCVTCFLREDFNIPFSCRFYTWKNKSIPANISPNKKPDFCKVISVKVIEED